MSAVLLSPERGRGHEQPAELPLGVGGVALRREMVEIAGGLGDVGHAAGAAPPEQEGARRRKDGMGVCARMPGREIPLHLRQRGVDAFGHVHVFNLGRDLAAPY